MCHLKHLTQCDFTILRTVSQNVLFICNSCVIRMDIFSFCSFNLSSTVSIKYFPNSSPFTVFLSFLGEIVKNSQTWLVAVLSRVNPQSTWCYSFLSLEVSGCDCLPDRCRGKSALSFLDSICVEIYNCLHFWQTEAAEKKEARTGMQKIYCDLILEFQLK